MYEHRITDHFNRLLPTYREFKTDWKNYESYIDCTERKMYSYRNGEWLLHIDLNPYYNKLRIIQETPTSYMMKSPHTYSAIIAEAVAKQSLITKYYKQIDGRDIIYHFADVNDATCFRSCLYDVVTPLT
jgi:hypothetical protein